MPVCKYRSSLYRLPIPFSTFENQHNPHQNFNPRRVCPRKLHRATLLFCSNGFYYSTFTTHNEPQMRLPSLHVSRICHPPKSAYSSKPHQPGRGSVPVARKRIARNPNRNRTNAKIKLSAKIAQYRNQISTLLGASPLKFRKL